MRAVFSPSWGEQQLRRAVARLDVQEAVFSARSFRRIAAPALDRRREILGRAPMWQRGR